MSDEQITWRDIRNAFLLSFLCLLVWQALLLAEGAWGVDLWPLKFGAGASCLFWALAAFAAVPSRERDSS